jgi:hypothetical protein
MSCPFIKEVYILGKGIWMSGRTGVVGILPCGISHNIHLCLLLLKFCDCGKGVLNETEFDVIT